jgi:cytochrome c oxidase subunit 1
MPRRIPDYPDAFEGWNYVSSFGSIISVVATVLFLYIIYDMLVTQPVAISNPWVMPRFFISTDIGERNYTLEWAVDSPTPYHAYHMMPVQS